jgi:hypothetical protein
LNNDRAGNVLACPKCNSIITVPNINVVDDAVDSLGASGKPVLTASSSHPAQSNDQIGSFALGTTPVNILARFRKRPVIVGICCITGLIAFMICATIWLNGIYNAEEGLFGSLKNVTRLNNQERKLIGSWSTVIIVQSLGRTEQQITYKGDGTYFSTVSSELPLGIKLRIKSQGTWSMEGNQLAIKTLAVDVEPKNFDSIVGSNKHIGKTQIFDIGTINNKNLILKDLETSMTIIFDRVKS